MLMVLNTRLQRNNLMNLLDGKYALVTGLANERSIAWGIARQLRAQGAQLMITCQNERLEGKTRELAKSIDAVARVCDLEDSGQMRELAEDLNERWPALDAVVMPPPLPTERC